MARYFLESALFNDGVSPASRRSSVSRVGGAAQIKARKSEPDMSLTLRNRELAAFRASSVSDLDNSTQRQLSRGQAVTDDAQNRDNISQCQ